MTANSNEVLSRKYTFKKQEYLIKVLTAFNYN